MNCSSVSSTVRPTSLERFPSVRMYSSMSSGPAPRGELGWAEPRKEELLEIRLNRDLLAVNPAAKDRLEGSLTPLDFLLGVV